MRILRLLAFACVALFVGSCNTSSGVFQPNLPTRGGASSAGSTRQAVAHHIVVPGRPKSKSQAKPHGTGNVVADPGFESGGFNNWSQCGNVTAYIQTRYVHTGAYAEKSGSYSTTSGEINGDAGVCQLVTIPSGGLLTVWVDQLSNEKSTQFAWQEADLLDSTGAIVHNFYTTVNNTHGWVQLTYDVSSFAGQSLYLYFGVHGDGYCCAYTIQDVDDVSVAGGATPSPSPSPTHTPTPTPSPTPTTTPLPSPSPSGGPTPLPSNPPPTPPPGGCLSCGVQRWHVKTLSDPQATQVNMVPQTTSVTSLSALPYPCGSVSNICPDNVREAPTELRAFRVRGNVVGWKLESDMDIHFVIADPNNASNTLIVEFPNSNCSGACSSIYHNDMAAARAKLVNCIGQPTSSFTTPPQPITLDVLGVGFFDDVHGQTGVAPNGIEIHPALDIQFVSGPCTNLRVHRGSTSMRVR